MDPFSYAGRAGMLRRPDSELHQPMHVLFLSDNFVPEQNAPALRTYDHCKRWVARGVGVTVVTTVPNFPTGRPQPPYRNKLLQREHIDGIDVVRVWSFLAPNAGVLRRGLDFGSFALSSLLAGLSVRADVIVATSPQLLTGLAAHLLSRLKGLPWLLEVRDLWPDSIVAVGAMRDGVAVRSLRGLERLLYRSADRLVVLNEQTQTLLAGRGVEEGKIGIIPNGVDTHRLAPRAKDAKLLASLNLQHKFVVGYVGTHGMAQGLDIVVRAAELVRDTNAHFLFVGEGATRRETMSLAERLGVQNVTFLDMVPANLVADYLALCDAVVVPLRRTPLMNVTVPSKIFEGAAMEKPLILCADGPAEALVRKYGAGLAVAPDDPVALAGAVTRLMADEDLRRQLGAGGRALAREFNRDDLAERMLEQVWIAAARRKQSRAY